MEKVLHDLLSPLPFFEINKLRAKTKLESVAVDELSEWLKSKGISSEFCIKFVGEFLNGNWVFQCIMDLL